MRQVQTQSHQNRQRSLQFTALALPTGLYAERSGFPWYILSAKHGLLAPETKIAPYDLALADLPTSKCRAWSQGVLDDLIVKFPSLRGTVIDIHAGKRYVEFGLENGLSDAGAIIRRPLARVVGIGPQCAWYREHLTLDSLQ